MPEQGEEKRGGFFRRADGTLRTYQVSITLLIAIAGAVAGLWKAFAPSGGSPPPSLPSVSNVISPQIMVSGGQSQVAIQGNIYNQDPGDAAMIRDLSLRLGSSEELIRGFFRRLREDGVPPEEWGAALDKIAANYLRFKREVEAFGGEDPEVKRLLAEALKLAEKADFAPAREKLQEARKRELDAAKALQEKSRERTAKAAEVAVMEANLLYLQGEHLQAAELYGQAAEMVRDYAPGTADDYLIESAVEYWLWGRRMGGDAYLDKSAGILASLLDRTGREAEPEKWARINAGLGDVLSIRGEREPGTGRLEQAAAAYRQALEVYTPEKFPDEWATTQGSLGNALRCLAERGTGTEVLEQAAGAYREVLLVHTRPDYPLSWAAAQVNLGNALGIWGMREGEGERLRQAVAAYRRALEVFTRGDHPRAWARIQGNMGNALRILGALGIDATANLERSVEACQGALEVYKEQVFPADAAGARTNLGNALFILAIRKADGKLAEQAVAAYEDALAQAREVGNGYLEKLLLDNLAEARRVEEELKREGGNGGN